MSTRYTPDPRDRPLIDSLTDRIEQRLPGWYGISSSLRSRDPEIRCYTNSFFLRYPVLTSAGEKAIVLKIRRNPKMYSLTQATRAGELHTNIPDEYQTLRHVFERIGTEHSHFTALRPLGYFEDCFAIVMEEFPSRSLRQLLKDHRAGSEAGEHRAAVQKIAERAGKLLRFFHEHVYAITPVPYSTVDILADAEPYTLRLQQHSGGRIDSRALLDALDQKLSGKTVRSIHCTSAHQDLTCDNVLYSKEGKVCLADIKVKPAPLYSDLGLLLIHPETFRDHFFRNGKYFSPQFMQDYRDSILRGYFGESPVDDFLVPIYAAIRVLDKWAMHQELFHNYKGWKRVLTRPLMPLVTSHFQRLWSSHLQRAK